MYASAIGARQQLPIIKLDTLYFFSWRTRRSSLRDAARWRKPLEEKAVHLKKNLTQRRKDAKKKDKTIAEKQRLLFLLAVA
ncbi:hypothetical protein NIES3275_22060 [Microchaete diplosiphon NIES-3275]|nr:hypothetical protein NIES3275_22060 [Microchaete diplosiphon NIES-3275]